MAPVAFAVDERRRRARERMAPDKEALAVELSVEGYHAWSQMLPHLVSGKIRVPVRKTGKKCCCRGQAANRLSDPDREVRRRVFEAYGPRGPSRPTFSTTLNNLAGYRLTLYKYGAGIRSSRSRWTPTA